MGWKAQVSTLLCVIELVGEFDVSFVSKIRLMLSFTANDEMPINPLLAVVQHRDNLIP